MNRTFPLSAHIGYLFSELPLRERISAARAAGFDAVEHPEPFDIPAAEMARSLAGEGMRFAQLSSGTGGEGLKGLACLPGRQRAFTEAFRRAVDYAERISCPFMHPMAGCQTADVTIQAVEATYRDNIEQAVRFCEQSPVSVLVEAISPAAVPGYLVCNHDRLNHFLAPYRHEVRVLLDKFHAAVNGDAIGLFLASSRLFLGHVHIADYPGRHEPGSGTLDFIRHRKLLTSLGYSGAIGFEYVPSGQTADHLGWMSDWQQEAGRKEPPGESVQ